MSIRYKGKFVDQPSSADLKQRLRVLDSDKSISEMTDKKIRWISKLDSDRPTFTIIWMILGFFLVLQILANFGRMVIYDQVKGPVSESYDETMSGVSNFFHEVAGIEKKKTTPPPVDSPNRW